MYYAEDEARKLIIEAGHRLLETGLIARTWGNISARISEIQYIITPSGRAYDTLRPEELVKVNISDGRYEGDIRPSGEKAVHAAVYMLKPDVKFVIHTHQVYASAVGVTGEDIMPDTDAILGKVIPCAAYGLPSSGKLCRNVMKAISSYQDANAVLMVRHGAICMGNTPDEVFSIAERLEQVCKAIYDDAVSISVSEDDMVESRKRAEAALCESMKLPVHGVAEVSPEVVLLAEQGRTLRPYLDDLAQIAGASIRCSSDIEAGLRDRAAVMVPGLGAYCVGDDAEAVAMILAKDAKARLYAAAKGNARPLGWYDAYLMRYNYVHKYSKQKTEKRR